MYMDYTNAVVSLGLVGQISLPLCLMDLNDVKKITHWWKRNLCELEGIFLIKHPHSSQTSSLPRACGEILTMWMNSRTL